MSDQPPKLFQEFHETIARKQLKLTKSLKLDEFPPGDVKDALVYGYSSKDVLDNVLAVLMNAVVASKKRSFILSRSLLIAYFEVDPNASKRSFSGEQHKRISGQITEVGFVKRVSESSKRPTIDRKAAVYEVIHPEVLKLIGEE